MTDQPKPASDEEIAEYGEALNPDELIARIDADRALIREAAEVLRSDTAGRSIQELMRLSADALGAIGGGPLTDSLRLFGQQSEALLAKLEAKR